MELAGLTEQRPVVPQDLETSPSPDVPVCSGDGRAQGTEGELLW